MLGECVVNKINLGDSDKIVLHKLNNVVIWVSIFQTSPLGPRPKDGGSMMRASYFRLRRYSRWRNFSASSTIQRTEQSASPEDSKFYRAQVTEVLEASKCVTFAPFAAAANVLAPV